MSERLTEKKMFKNLLFKTTFSCCNVSFNENRLLGIRTRNARLSQQHEANGDWGESNLLLIGNKYSAT